MKRGFFQGLPSDIKQGLQSLMFSRQQKQKTIDICHSTPNVWSPEAEFGWDSVPCPSSTALYKIGRTMYETDRVPVAWIPRLRRMDEIWVPTRWAQDIFQKEIGQESDVRVVVIPEAVDTQFFDPAREHTNLSVLKRQNNMYTFLSVLKFETRKNWKDLIEAFFDEFDSNEKVRLVLKTSEFHNDRSVKEEIEEFLHMKNHKYSKERLVLIHQMLKTEELPSLYAAANAFVLPSHGEGWGRPHVEAMSMSLPVIATNWSGPTEFMNEKNSLPLKVQRMIKSSTNGHLWAKPSMKELRRLMRWCVENPILASKIGERARKDMVDLYNPERVAGIVVRRLSEVREAMLNGDDDREL